MRIGIVYLEYKCRSNRTFRAPKASGGLDLDEYSKNFQKGQLLDRCQLAV